MKIREHRGGFDESMATTVEIEPNLEAVARHVGVTDPSTVTLKKYGPVPVDPRNGWNTHVVKVNGLPWGFTDGPLDLNVTPAECPRCHKLHACFTCPRHYVETLKGNNYGHCTDPHKPCPLCFDCLKELSNPAVWALIDAAKAYKEEATLPDDSLKNIRTRLDCVAHYALLEAAKNL